MKQPDHEDNKLGSLNPAFMKPHHLTIFAPDPLAQRQTEVETWIRPATSSRDEAYLNQAGRQAKYPCKSCRKVTSRASGVRRFCGNCLASAKALPANRQATGKP